MYRLKKKRKKEMLLFKIMKENYYYLFKNKYYCQHTFLVTISRLDFNYTHNLSKSLTHVSYYSFFAKAS